MVFTAEHCKYKQFICKTIKRTRKILPWLHNNMSFGQCFLWNSNISNGSRHPDRLGHKMFLGEFSRSQIVLKIKNPNTIFRSVLN